MEGCMFKKLLTVTLVFGLAQEALAAGPIEKSITENARTAAQSTAGGKPAGSNKPMIWTGVAMMGVGAGLASASVALGQNSMSCPGPVTTGTASGPCVFQSEASRGALWSGIGLAGMGAVVSILGAKPRADITVRRGEFRVSKVITF
jgi:hypothetical protein